MVEFVYINSTKIIVNINYQNSSMIHTSLFSASKYTYELLSENKILFLYPS